MGRGCQLCRVCVRRKMNTARALLSLEGKNRKEFSMEPAPGLHVSSEPVLLHFRRSLMCGSLEAALTGRMEVSRGR